MEFQLAVSTASRLKAATKVKIPTVNEYENSIAEDHNYTSLCLSPEEKINLESYEYYRHF